MSSAQKITLFLLRISLGWMFFYAGVMKLLNPAWSAAGYVQGAKTATWFYQALLNPNVLPFINGLNEWGILLIGASLLLGIFVRLGAISGIMLMFLYYLPILSFPYVGTTHAFLVDEHIIYISALTLLAVFRAGRVWGLEPWCSRLPICSRYPRLRSWLG